MSNQNELKKLDNYLRQMRNDQLIIRQTADQIIKDFGMFGFELSFPDIDEWIYQRLFDGVFEYVNQMLMNDDRKLFSLLYQIDISEVAIKKQTAIETSKSLPEVVTEMIIERELKKVITRHYFSFNRPDSKS